jgi:hypothetical protein
MVELLNADTGEVVASTTTDARGSYGFDVSTGLGLGRYRVRVVFMDGLGKPVISPVLALTRGETFLMQVNLGIAPAR